MNREKLLQSPLPIDRQAARVIKPAKPEHVWRPMPKETDHHVPVGAVLATKPVPAATLRNLPALATLPGQRRDRMRIVGYAAHQSESKNKGALWVVRCDCGNYEHRASIFRWLGTAAPDMCRECRTRTYKMRGEWGPRDPAKRATAPQEKP